MMKKILFVLTVLFLAQSSYASNNELSLDRPVMKLTFMRHVGNLDLHNEFTSFYFTKDDIKYIGMCDTIHLNTFLQTLRRISTIRIGINQEDKLILTNHRGNNNVALIIKKR